MSNLVINKEHVITILNEIIQKFLIPKFMDLGMNASGQWIDSLEADFENNVGYIKGQDYTKYLVEGRPGGSMPPINAIIEWVQNKLGYSGQEAISVAWAVATKIKNEGTNYYPNGTDLLEVLQSKEVTDYFNERLGFYYIEQITTEFNRQLNQL